MENNTDNISKKDIMKFLIPSMIGIFLFLIPIPYNDSFSVPIGLVSDELQNILGDFLLYVVVAITSIVAIISTWATFFKPSSILKNDKLKGLLITSPLYLASRILGAVISILVVFNIGPEFIISGDTGGTMIGISKSLIAIIVSISYLMPLLTDFGVMEYTGILIRKIVRPLFTLPGRSAIDLITSWLGAANAAVLLTKRQFDTGYYSAREAAVIMTNFSLVSVPFCLIVASFVGVQSYFPQLYIITTIVGFILAIIIPRIPPLSKIPDVFSEKTGKVIDESVPEGISVPSWALRLAVERAKKNDLKQIISIGNDMLFGVLFNMTAIVISWGTIGLILVEYTPIFKILSYPMGAYLQLLGVEQAFEAAPATLVGFADMFIPSLLLTGITSITTKFIMAVLSLVQIVYLTEVGIIAIQSDVPLNLSRLFIIFIERTIIAIPLIVLLTKLVF